LCYVVLLACNIIQNNLKGKIFGNIFGRNLSCNYL
jgi:hypothetical protein